MTTRTKKLRSIRDLVLDDQNANRGTDRGRQLVGHSLERYGAGRSVLADKHGKLIAGNKTVEKALELNKKILVVPTKGDELVVVQRTDLDMDQDHAARELAIADNRAGELGLEWDPEMLQLLQDQGVALDAMFDPRELEEIIARGPGDDDQDEEDLEIEIDQGGELQKKWKVKRGELWQIGPHRLMCGDATKPEDLAQLMGDDQATLLITDPPYNVAKRYSDKVNDEKSRADYQNFLRTWFSLWQAVSERQIVTIGRRRFEEGFWLGLALKATGCWIKTNAVSRGRVTQSSCWEPLIFAGERWDRTRPNDVFDFPIGAQSESQVANHPCPKPLKFWLHLIDQYSSKGELVADAFGGTGTTIAACAALERVARVMEIEPKWCAVTLERMTKAFPGLEIGLKTPTLRKIDRQRVRPPKGGNGIRKARKTPRAIPPGDVLQLKRNGSEKKSSRR